MTSAYNVLKFSLSVQSVSQYWPEDMADDLFTTVLQAKSDSDVMFCLQRYRVL